MTSVTERVAGDTAEALAADNRASLHQALADARTAIRPTTERVTGSAVSAALAAVGVPERPGADPGLSLQATLHYHGVRSREVVLEPGWHRHSGMVLLATAGGRRVALLPRRFRDGYRLYDPADGRSRAVTRAAASEVSAHAVALYRPLPDATTSLRRMLRFALTGSARDVMLFLVTGLVFGLLAMAVPVSLGTLVPRLLAGGAGQEWWLLALLAAVTTTAGLSLLVRNAMAIRLQSRIQAALEPAVWDRLLRHDVAFFRQFSTGELVQRGNAIAQVRRTLSDVMVGAALGAFFSLASVVVVLVMAPSLGLILVGALAAGSAVLAVLARRQERHETVVTEAYGEVYGMLYAVLLGIDKIQTAGREIQAMARWAAVFGRQKQADGAAVREQAASSAVSAALQPLLIAALLAGVAVFHLHPGLSDLVVASVAAAQVALAVGQLSQVAGTAFGIAPALRRLRPVLATPRLVGGTVDPGRLEGSVTLDAVTFRYPGAHAPTLDAVSLHAAAGEMVAVVGPSGAGKSTIIRLLLGFEWPESGAVRYGAQALADVDLRLIRRQIGTVLQHATMLRGTLLENIVGPTGDLTEADAWAAADIAGIGDDLRRLPMGLHTRVNESGEGFSGGQVQRLFLARALVRQPAVLLLDEATSALDNRTQAIVTERIAALSCTRIVVAHRLSTIEAADRIVVVDGGRVVASGGHAELVATCPLFARLVRTQEARRS